MKKNTIRKPTTFEHPNKNGFTLIELSIVILIIGILILPLLQLYDSYLIRKQMIVTRENVQTAVDGLSLTLNRYPCPSDRSLAPGDPNFGIEQCDMATIPLCSVAGLQGICKVQSAFNRDAPPDAINDYVVIGGVPLSYYQAYTAAVPDPSSLTSVSFMRGNSILDGWGNKLTYAVTENVMRPNRIASVIQKDFKAGVISAIDENGNATAGIADNALFVVLSHGKDALGAFSYQGIPFNNCQATMHGENCDEDTTFMQGIELSDGADPFDDISKFFIVPEGELWRLTGTLDAFDQSLPHIRNMNANNVGINMPAAPTVTLEVGGTIRADSVRTDNICDENGINCFKVSDKFGTGMPTSSGGNGVCPSGQIITGLAGGIIQCGYPTFDAPPAKVGLSKTCPLGQYVSSIRSDGCISCNGGAFICP